MIHETFTVGDQPEIDVRIHAGRVEVRKGEPGIIEVQVETNDRNFRVQQRGDLVEAHSDREARWIFSSPAEVTISMPPRGRATIRTASADVVVHASTEKLEVDSASGDVRIDTGRRILVKTASGNIRVDAVEEVFKGRSASGDVRIGSAHGNMEISTASGDIRIDDTDAIIDAATASGRIQIDRYVGNEVSMKSMSGGFEIGMEPGTKVDLDASSLSGRVKWPPKPAVPSEIKRETSLRAKSVSGDLTIKRLT